MRPSLVIFVLLSGCAATLVESTMPNLTHTNGATLHAAQEYDEGPYKENHRYKITVSASSPQTVEAEIRLVDSVKECALPESYQFTLVDDRGNRRAFTPAGPSERGTEAGHGGAALTVGTMKGRFDGPIATDARAITIEMRKASGASCPEFDFRWRFE